MGDIPISALSVALVVLLLLSGVFSMSETCMMAANRYRLRHLANQGHQGARLALDLLDRTEKLLGVVLLGNNLLNAAAATLVSVITIELFGEDKWLLGAGTLFVTFAILVVSEIVPKIIGATHADRLASTLSFVLWPLLRASYPVVWFVNLFAMGLLRLMRIKPFPSGGSQPLSPEELRGLVLESRHAIPHQHRDILLNLFDLDQVTVEDIMTPRGEIEAIDLSLPADELQARLSTSFHSRIPVYEGEPDNIVGILRQRRLLPHILGGHLDQGTLREELAEPYFVPAATSIYAQLQFFRDNRQKLGLVVDEYGELRGLVTLEDIIQEIVGKFPGSALNGATPLAWDDEGIALVDGAENLREINRSLGLGLPTDGPKTLNGLVVEHLRDIPEVGVGIEIAGVRIEIVQTQDRKVKTLRLFRPQPAE